MKSLCSQNNGYHIVYYILGTHHTSMFIWNGVVWAKQNEGKSLLLYLCFNSQSKEMLRLRAITGKKQALKNLCFCRPVTPKVRTVMTTVLSPHKALPVNTLQVSVKTSWELPVNTALCLTSMRLFSSIAQQDSESNMQLTKHRRRNRSALSCGEKRQSTNWVTSISLHNQNSKCWFLLLNNWCLKAEHRHI